MLALYTYVFFYLVGAKVVIFFETNKKMLSFLIKPRGKSCYFMTKPRLKTTFKMTKPRGKRVNSPKDGTEIRNPISLRDRTPAFDGVAPHCIGSL